MSQQPTVIMLLQSSNVILASTPNKEIIEHPKNEKHQQCRTQLYRKVYLSIQLRPQNSFKKLAQHRMILLEIFT